MTPPNARKKAFYANSSVQVLFAVAAAIALGYLRPAMAMAGALRPDPREQEAQRIENRSGRLQWLSDSISW